MSILKQSTAATIKLGPFVDDTDGKTAETALTIGQADIRLSKNGGDIAQTNNATGATHDELGYYNIPLDTTDTGTLGRLRVLVSKAGALPVWQDFVVVTANVYDSMFSTDKLDVAVVEMATDVLTAASVKADAVTKIQNGLATSAALDTVDANVDSILADTGTDGVVLASTQGAITWAQQKIVADVANEGALDITNTNAEGIGQRNLGTKIGQANIAINTNAGENAIGQRNSGTSTNGNNTALVYGQQNKTTVISGAALDSESVSGFDSALALEATLTAIKGAGWTNQTLVKIVTDISAISAGSGATPQQIWEYATRTITGLPTMPTDWVTAAGLKADAVTEIQSGLATAAALDAVDNFIDTEVAAILAAVDTEVAAIKAKTDNLPASPAAVGSAMTLTAAYDKAKDDVLTPLAVVDGIVDAIKVQTDKIPATPASAGEYTANIGAIKAKTDNLPLSPASSGEYTSALTAIQNDLDNPNQYKADVSGLATQTSVNAIPTTPLLAANYIAPDNAGIAAIKTKTDSLTFTTPNKVDASATVNPTGIATSAELEIVGGKVDGVLNKLNVSSVEFVTAVVGSTITILRGDTLSARLLDLGDFTQYVSLDFTVKLVSGELDDAARIRLRKNASGTGDGLLRLNGAEYATATDGSIVIDDLTTGDIEIKLTATATQELVPGNYVYDVQIITANEVRTLTAGKLEVVADVTRAVA
jgi:hypothetical protein